MKLLLILQRVCGIAVVFVQLPYNGSMVAIVTTVKIYLHLRNAKTLCSPTSNFGDNGIWLGNLSCGFQ